MVKGLREFKIFVVFTALACKPIIYWFLQASVEASSAVSIQFLPYLCKTDVGLDRKKIHSTIDTICNCCDGFQEVPVYWEAYENVKDEGCEPAIS